MPVSLPYALRFPTNPIDQSGWASAQKSDGDILTADTILTPYKVAINRWEAGETVLSMGHMSTFFASPDTDMFTTPNGLATVSQHIFPFENSGYTFARFFYEYKLSDGGPNGLCSLIYAEILGNGKATSVTALGAGTNSLAIASNLTPYQSDFPDLNLSIPDRRYTGTFQVRLPDPPSYGVTVVNYLRITLGTGTPGIQQYNNNSNDYKYGLKFFSMKLFGTFY